MAMRALLFSVVLYVVGLSSSAWGAVDGTSWLLDLRAKATAGKAGNIVVTEPYNLTFGSGTFALQAQADETLGFSGNYSVTDSGKISVTPADDELKAYLVRKIEAAAEAKGVDVAIETLTIKRVGSSSRVVQDWAELKLNLGISVSYSYTGTVNELPVKASGVLVLNAKGALADEGKSDTLPGSTWNFSLMEKGSVKGLGKYSSPATMTLEFGAENQVLIRTENNLTIGGTYTLDEINKKIVFNLSESDVVAYISQLISEEAEVSATVSGIVSSGTATFAGGVMKFTGRIDFTASAYDITAKGTYQVKGAGVNVTP